MIPTVVLALALVTSTFALPLTTQEQIATGSEGFSPVHTEVPQAQFVEKTGSEVHPQQAQPSNPVPKVENVPVNLDHPQVSYTEKPVLLPIQPLSVVPQVGQVLRPVIVPAEAITAGRVIIAGIETIQQRNFQDEVAAVEPQVPYQQVVQQVYSPQTQVLEPSQQPYYPQPVEKHTPQQQITPTGQVYVPVQVQTSQEQLVREQTVQQTAENYKPTPVEQNAQVYTVQQNAQQIVVPEYPEKQGSYQGVTDFNPSQTLPQQVQQYEEKQGLNPQGSGYGPVQTQGVEYQQQQVYSGAPVVTENVEKQVQQVGTYTGQQAYDVQQNFEKQGQYQQGYTPVQTQTVEQQGIEKVPYQQPSQRVEPFEQVHQQVYNNKPVEHVQPAHTNPLEQQVYSVQQSSQASHQQQPVVPEQFPKTTEVEQQQFHPEQTVNHASETAYNFGAKIPQQTVQTLSGLPHTHTAPVQPSVASTQQ